MNAGVNRGEGTRGQVSRQVGGVDTIEIKVTIPGAQIEPALNRCGLTVDNDERRYIYGFCSAPKENYIATSRGRLGADRQEPKHLTATVGLKME